MPQSCVFFRTMDPDLCGGLCQALSKATPGRFAVGPDGHVSCFRCAPEDAATMTVAAKWYAEGWMGRADQIRCGVAEVDPLGQMLDAVQEQPDLVSREAAMMVAVDEEDGERFDGLS